MAEPNRGRQMNVLLRKATDLHGHFGPFLSLGVRMGLSGLRELGAGKGDADLHVKVSLVYALPFSCMLDGIQTSTQCTIGNKKLEWKESKEFAAVFSQQNSGREVKIKINPTVVHELHLKLEGTRPMDEIVGQIALEIWTTPENELFSVSHKQ